MYIDQPDVATKMKAIEALLGSAACFMMACAKYNEYSSNQARLSKLKSAELHRDFQELEQGLEFIEFTDVLLEGRVIKSDDAISGPMIGAAEVLLKCEITRVYEQDGRVHETSRRKVYKNTITIPFILVDDSPNSIIVHVNNVDKVKGLHQVMTCANQEITEDATQQLGGSVTNTVTLTHQYVLPFDSTLVAYGHASQSGFDGTITFTPYDISTSLEAMIEERKKTVYWKFLAFLLLMVAGTLLLCIFLYNNINRGGISHI